MNRKRMLGEIALGGLATTLAWASYSNIARADVVAPTVGASGVALVLVVVICVVVAIAVTVGLLLLRRARRRKRAHLAAAANAQQPASSVQSSEHPPVGTKNPDAT
jgi:hypothetical protein